MISCLFCGNPVELIHVHGHYQCPVCKTNTLPCCDGDNCDTNYLLNKNNTGQLHLQYHLITGNIEIREEAGEINDIEVSAAI
jgi:hypothetical protein